MSLSPRFGVAQQRMMSTLPLASFPTSFPSASSLKKMVRPFSPKSKFHLTKSSHNCASDMIPIQETAWYQESELRSKILTSVIPPMSSTGYKGSSGRIGILGGSPHYTGAPYYAAMAALKMGADLATCFCAQEASIPIKVRFCEKRTVLRPAFHHTSIPHFVVLLS